jgi:hypothetical protein
MVRKVDLSTELQILAFHEQRRMATRLAVDAGLATVEDALGDPLDTLEPSRHEGGPTRLAR